MSEGDFHERIDGFWAEYLKLLDRSVEHPDEPKILAETVVELDDLAGRVEQRMCSTTGEESDQLRLWAATFRDLSAQLLLDLGRIAEAIQSYRRSLALHDDLEQRVFFAKALFRSGDFDTAANELNVLAERSESFSSTGDAESAARVLNMVCNCEEMSGAVDARIVMDCIRTLARRGSVAIVLEPSGAKGT